MEFESLPWRKRHDAKVNKTGPTKTGRLAIGSLQRLRAKPRNSFRMTAKAVARAAVAAFA